MRIGGLLLEQGKGPFRAGPNSETLQHTKGRDGNIVYLYIIQMHRYILPKTLTDLYDKCVPGGVQSLEHVRNVLTNLVSGLQAEEIEVAEQVIVRRQKLQIQLGQSQTMFPCKCSDTKSLTLAGQTQQNLRVSLQSVMHAT